MAYVRFVLSATAALCLAGVFVSGCGPSLTEKVLCVNNLSMLWKMQALYADRKDEKVLLPTETGAKFWTVLFERQDPSKGPLDPSAFVCPLSGTAPGKNVTTYLGPKADVNTLGPDDVVGCCSSIHSDGSISVLKKNGSVVLVEEGEPLYKTALAATRK